MKYIKAGYENENISLYIALLIVFNVPSSQGTSQVIFRRKNIEGE